MGIKNSSKKPNLVKREGFYVVLFVCLCVIAIVTVYISKTNSLKKEQELAKKPTVKVEEKMQDAEQVKKEQANATVPTMKRSTKEDEKSNNNSETKNTNAKKEDSKEEKKEESKDTSSKKNTISLVLPVKGEITKKFYKDDLQYTKALDIWETHEAIDIAASIGTEVKAAAKGKVIDVYNDDKAEKTLKSGYGLTVVIEHDNGYRTLYSNLADNLRVKKGDKIEAGAAIGVIGETSVREDVKVEGSHLHFGVLQKGSKDYETVNPETYLKK